MPHKLVEFRLSPKSALESAISSSIEEEAQGRTITAFRPLQMDGNQVILAVDTSRAGTLNREDLYALDTQSNKATRIIGVPIEERQSIAWRFFGDTTLFCVTTEYDHPVIFRKRYAVGSIHNKTKEQQQFKHVSGFLMHNAKGPMSLSLGDKSVHAFEQVEITASGNVVLVCLDNRALNPKLVNLLSSNFETDRGFPRLDDLVKIGDNHFATVVRYGGGYYLNTLSSDINVFDSEGNANQEIHFKKPIVSASSLNGFLSVVLQHGVDGKTYGKTSVIYDATARTYQFDGRVLKKVGEQKAFCFLRRNKYGPRKDSELVDFHLVDVGGETSFLFAYKNYLRITNLAGETISEIDFKDEKKENPDDSPGDVVIKYHLLSSSHLVRTVFIPSCSCIMPDELLHTETIDVSSGRLLSKMSYGHVPVDKRPELYLLDGFVCSYSPNQDSLDVLVARAA